MFDFFLFGNEKSSVENVTWDTASFYFQVQEEVEVELISVEKQLTEDLTSHMWK